MNFAQCWHRPGSERGAGRLCRTCGIGIQECPCVSYMRSPERDCPLCEGSGWVSVVRSKLQAFRDVLDGGYVAHVGWDDPDR